MNSKLWQLRHSRESVLFIAVHTRVASTRFQRLHDVVFFYSKSGKPTFNGERIAYGEQSGKRDSHYKQDDDGRWYRWQKRKNAEPYKIFLSDGVRLGDWWKIAPINASAKERLGYPTQKPEALLERIIKASSNEGDVVLDAYCGCGTTIAGAQRLDRCWIGVDITYQSIALILKRLEDRYPAQWPEIEANILLDARRDSCCREIPPPVAEPRRRPDSDCYS